MGNSESTKRGEEYFIQFENKFKYEVKQLTQYSDVFFQNVTLYHERDSKRVIAQVKKQNEIDHFDPSQERQLQERIKDDKQLNLLKVYGYYSNLQQDNICGNSYFRNFFVEHPVGTLQDEIQLRKSMETPAPYSELELWGFLHSIVKGLVALKEKEKKCKNISSSTIFINLEGYYQICELGIVKDNSIFDEICFKEFRKDMYLSPGQMEVIKDMTMHDETDPYMSDIFALGVLVTELAYLEEQGDIYRYFGPEIGISQQRLVERIQYLETKYKNKKLIRILTNMTNFEQKKRITLDELYEEVERNYGRLIIDMNDNQENNMQECPAHRTPIIDKIINREQYEHLYHRKGRGSSIESPGLPQRGNKKKKTYKINFEDNFGEDGIRETRILPPQSMSQIQDDAFGLGNNEGTLHHIKNDEIASNTTSTSQLPGPANKLKSHLSRILPGLSIQLSEFLKKKTKQKEELVQKQQELEKVPIKTKEQQQEIVKIKEQIIEIDQSIEQEKNSQEPENRNNTPNKQVHFQSTIEEEQSPQVLIQSRPIKVQSSVTPDDIHDLQISSDRVKQFSNRPPQYPHIHNLQQSEFTNYEEDPYNFPGAQFNLQYPYGRQLNKRNSSSASPSIRSYNFQFQNNNNNNQYDQILGFPRGVSANRGYISPKYLAYSNSYYDGSNANTPYSQRNQFFVNNPLPTFQQKPSIQIQNQQTFQQMNQQQQYEQSQSFQMQSSQSYQLQQPLQQIQQKQQQQLEQQQLLQQQQQQLQQQQLLSQQQLQQQQQQLQQQQQQQQLQQQQLQQKQQQQQPQQIEQQQQFYMNQGYNQQEIQHMQFQPNSEQNSTQPLNYQQQNPQYGELFMPSQYTDQDRLASPQARRYNLDRYDQRLSRYNVCSNKYNNLKELFGNGEHAHKQQQIQNQEDIENSANKSFRNKLIKKQSIQQIILSKSTKKLSLHQLRAVSPLEETKKKVTSDFNSQLINKASTTNPKLLQNRQNQTHRGDSTSAVTKILKKAEPNSINQQLLQGNNRQKFGNRAQNIYV